MSEETPVSRPAHVVEACDLPLHCPMPKDALWNAHPRVYLRLVETGEARCPYCGTLYRLQHGSVLPHH